MNKHKGSKWNVEGFDFTEEEKSEIRLQAEIIKTIAKVKGEKGLTRKEVAELAGVTPQAITRLESGDVNSQIDTILKILQPLGYTLVVAPSYVTKTITTEEKIKFADEIISRFNPALLLAQ